LIEYDNSILPFSPMKAGEENPQDKEEGKLVFIKNRAQFISGLNSQNVGM